MKPYGIVPPKRCKIHSADKCGICSTHPVSNKNKRAKNKIELNKEINDESTS